MTQYKSSSPLVNIEHDNHVIVFGTVYARDPETGGVWLPLSGYTYSGHFALIDQEDLYRVGRRGWSACRPTRRGDRELLYARASVDGKAQFLHRFILDITDRNIRVDHVNHNGLDNRKDNLRFVTHQQNIFNRRPNLIAASPYKGVYWHNQCEKWSAFITCNKKRHYLGVYTDDADAARAYDAKARELFGEHAYLNFPDAEEIGGAA